MTYKSTCSWQLQNFVTKNISHTSSFFISRLFDSISCNSYLFIPLHYVVQYIRKKKYYSCLCLSHKSIHLICAIWNWNFYPQTEQSRVFPFHITSSFSPSPISLYYCISFLLIKNFLPGLLLSYICNVFSWYNLHCLDDNCIIYVYTSWPFYILQKKEGLASLTGLWFCIIFPQYNIYFIISDSPIIICSNT